MTGRVVSINTSRGGVPKMSVFEALVTEHGVSGDDQSDPRYHGGPDRAAVLFSLEVIHALQGEGHPIGVGTVGENFTVSGLDWPSIVPGTSLAIGEAIVEITKYATPCTKVRESFAKHDFMRIYQEHHPGWSRLCARVLKSGLVRPGDVVALVNGQ